MDMQYTFGYSDASDNETLLTKGEYFTNLKGFQQVVQEFPDCIRTDYFHIINRSHLSSDAEGNKYTWYEIDHHNLNIDRTPILSSKIDYLSMMTGIDMLDNEVFNNGSQFKV